MEEEVNAEVKCPNCGSERIFRNGHRYTENGEDIQRWLCSECGFRFSDKAKELLGRGPENRSNQLCAILEEAKKLETAIENQTIAGDTTTYSNKISELAWWLQKN